MAERKIIKDFTGGINRATDPVKMKDNEFYDFQNLIIYKPGSIGNAIKRNGIENWHGPAVSDTDKAMQLYQYISNSKTTNFDRLIVKSDSKLKYIATAGNGGTYTNIIASDVGNKVRFLTFRDNLYITNRSTTSGGNTTYYTNQFYNGTNVADMGIPPAKNNFAVGEIATPAGRTALPVGKYYYIITYVYDDLQESYFVPNTDYDSGTGLDTSALGNTFFVASSIDRFAWRTVGASKVVQLTLPVSPSTRVTARRIYRTKVNPTTLQFYFLAEIPNNTDTQFIDDTPDATLFEPLDLPIRFKPPFCKYAVQHKDRMFIANLREDYYSAKPDVTGATATPTTGGSIAKLSTVNYRFRNLYLYPTINNTIIGTPLQGFLGSPTTDLIYTQITAGNSAATIAGVVNSDLYGAKTLVERTITTLISAYTGDGTTTVLTVTRGTDFNVGEKIIVANITAINGTYTLTAKDATTLTFLSSINGTGTLLNGVASGEWAYVGVLGTGDTSLTDLSSGEQAYGSKGILESNNIETLTSDKVLPSTLQFSDINYGDSFPPDNSIDVDSNDNDVISGIVAEDDGILIFKERNIYKLYTSGLSSQWELRKVVSNVGCDEPYSIVTIGVNTHLFMTNNEIWIYNNSNVKKISERIQPIIDGYIITNVDVCFHSKRNWVVYTIGHDSVNEIFILDLNFPQNGEIGSWYHFTQTTTTTNGLSVRSPLSTKAGLLLFGNDLMHILQYRKSDAYVDYINNAGTASTANISITLKKYFDFGNWLYKRTLAKINPQVTADADALTFSIASKGSTYNIGALSATKGRINDTDTTNTIGDLGDTLLSVISTGIKALEIKELGFDYIEKHKERGDY